MTDYSVLKRLAEACVAAGEYLPGEAGEEARSYCQAEVAFLEFAPAATPATVLALITENEAFEDGMRSLASTLGAGGYNAATLTAGQLVEKVQWGANHLAETSGRVADDLRAERERLKAENEALRQVLASSHEFILNDARTRHMCDETGQVSPLFPKRVGILAAIDAAMGKREQS